MKDTLHYKDFIGSVHFSEEDAVFYGKIEGINDLVSFEGQTVEQIRQSFREAVDDYVDLCEQHGKPTHKSYKGSFNVRVSPELHRLAAQKARQKGLSLNQLVQEAIEKEVLESAGTRK
ncbi:MAG: type II toxin-antitoxin system HicB family antitoxin [Acidobacteria bacterium]|nr:MAG: type II toxin-antitoxin system HicB family antitoxin [Acidobacteriota bacterium]RPJ63775.1 MAG: type II toxin-antitoxin system HicB family antitoxin [Acidobacteriota bacterium]